MKVRGYVKAVREDGSDELVVEVVGMGAGQARWLEPMRSEVRVQNTPAARRAFFVGREVVVTLEPAS